MRVDVRGSRELQAAIFAMKAANRDLRRTLYADARATLREAWGDELRGRATTTLQQKVLVSTARTRVTTQAFTVTTAKAKRKLRGGLVPARDWPAVELGAAPRPATIEAVSRKGRPYRYRRVQNRMHKDRRLNGYVAFPSAKRIGHRLLALWVQSIVRTYRTAAEGRRP